MRYHKLKAGNAPHLCRHRTGDRARPAAYRQPDCRKRLAKGTLLPAGKSGWRYAAGLALFTGSVTT